MLSEEVAILATSAHTAGSQSIVLPTAFSQPMFSEAENHVLCTPKCVLRNVEVFLRVS
jgi:hypothetical protein